MKRSQDSGITGADQIRAEINALGLDIPPDIQAKIDDQIAHNDLSNQISPLELSNELLSLLPGYKGKMLGSIVLACIGELFAFASYFFGAYAAGWLLASLGSNPLPWNDLVFWSLMALGSLVLHLILTGASSMISHGISFKILDRLRTRLFEKLQEVPQGYLVENPVGKIKVLLQERVAELEDWTAHMVPEMPSRALHPLLCIIILFVIDWRLGLAIFAPLPIILLGMVSMMSKYKGRMTVWVASYANVADRSTEYVRGIPIIKAFLQDKQSYQRFSDAVNFYNSSTMAWWRQTWLGNALVLSGTMSPLLASLPVAFYLYSNGQITVQSLLLAIVLPLSILPQAFAFMSAFELFHTASNTWLSIRELLYMPAQVRPAADKPAALDPAQGVRFDDVHFSYLSGVEVLHGVSFTAEKNAVTALVGPSGSGKSTIARLLAGFWDPSSGTISLGGANTQDIPFKQLMEEISYVSQDNFLFDCSIKDNIRLGKPNATDEEIVAAAKAAHCHEFIMELPQGYETTAGDAGGALSGGERQRITLARAILKPANIIVLDEATAYADPENEALIQEAISHLVKGKSLLVVAHRLHTIRHAQKIVVMEKGAIAAQGTHDQLVQDSPLYRRLWKQYCGEEL